jgi:sterol desaturase/sphingolipid hydroxylase (fatty acid hydroxylase superfamily)
MIKHVAPKMIEAGGGSIINTASIGALITTTFHDQHHKYFNFNFGGYTTIWDRICGTMRVKFEADFDMLKTRGALSARTTPDSVQSGVVEN